MIDVRPAPGDRWAVVWLGDGGELIATLAGPYKSEAEARRSAREERARVSRQGVGVRR